VIERDTDLDELMRAIRADIDASRSPEEKRARSADPIAKPSARAPQSQEPDSAYEIQVAMPESSGPSHARDSGKPLETEAPKAKRAKKKFFAKVFDVRVLLQRALGLRRLAKLAPHLEALRNGPVPIEELSFAVNDLRQDIARMSAELAAVEGKLLGRVASVAIRSRLANDELAGRIANTDALEGRFEDRIAESRDHADRGRIELFEGAERVHSTLERHWREIADQKRRLDLLVGEIRRKPLEPSPALQTPSPRPAPATLDWNFDDRFRDPVAESRQGGAVYFDSVRKACEATGRRAVLDLRCGNGDFLELLATEGFEASGVESNPAMVERCRARGLEVVERDAIEHLQGLPEGGLACVSAFRVIERLSHDALLALVSLALRALAPGGALILETPDPANLLVAAERFYYDPMRRNPLPSELVAFLVEACGFVDVAVAPRHPLNHAPRAYDDPMLALLQEKLYGPQDYGVIAWKPL